MNKKGSAAIALLVILVIISLGLSAGMFYFFQQERITNAALQGDLNALNEKYASIESELNQEKKRVSILNSQIKATQERLDDLNSELQEEKSARQESLSMIDELNSALEEKAGLASDLEVKLIEAQEDIEQKQNLITELESKKEALESRIKDFEGEKQRVQLGTIVVGPQGAVSQEEVEATETSRPMDSKSTVGLKAKGNVLEGQVLVVNKDYNFAVINLGSLDGIKVGDVFSVYQKETFLGDIKVEKVHDSMSAAGFAVDYLKNKIREGDRVVQKVK